MAAPEAPFLRFLKLAEQGDGCWTWKGSTMNSGYGQIKVFGRMRSAHRFAFELYKGPIPPGAEVLHSCDNKRCVNPAHLRIGTHAENMAEAGARGRMRSGPAHPQFRKRHPRPGQAHPVAVLGKTYASKKEAERALGLGAGTVRWWLKNKPEKAHLIQKEP